MIKMTISLNSLADQQCDASWRPRKQALRSKGILLVAIFLCFVKSIMAQSDGEQAFKDFLSGNTPIKSLHFTEVDCQTGNHRHFFAAVDTNGFFLREYNLAEDPADKISLNRPPQSSDFYGKYGNTCWNIDAALEINKTDISDPTVNYCQLGAKTSKSLIDTVLNLGASGFTVKNGSFEWDHTNSTRFTIQPLNGVTITRQQDGLIMRRLPGRIWVTNGLVVKMGTVVGLAFYEYATNLPVPFGIPTKITCGKSVSDCDRIYLIEELQLGHVDNPQDVFNPETKFISTNMASIVLIKNGVRQVLFRATERLTPPPIESIKIVHKKGNNVRLLVVGVMIGTSVILFLLLRSSRNQK
jgi:hypothetical protein